MHRNASNRCFSTDSYFVYVLKTAQKKLPLFLFQDSGTARPIQRKLTSQLQSETESAEDKAKHTEHLELSAELTKLLLPVLLEVRIIFGGFFDILASFWPFFDDFWDINMQSRVQS